jgi:cytoskeletal protein CcmA (bactofilin family)
MATDDATPTAISTTIGSTIVIRGKLKVDEDLVVKGRIEAALSSSKALIVESSGVVKANVVVESARISGVLVGNVQAKGKVEIASDGRVMGDLMAPRIVISDGAAFRGHIDMEGAAEEHESKTDETEPSATIAIAEPALVAPDATPSPSTATPRERLPAATTRPRGKH